MYLPEALSIHPRDYARLKAVGKTVADMGTIQRVASQVRNIARHPRRDVRAVLRGHRLRSGIGKAGKKIAQDHMAAREGLSAAKTRLAAHASGSVPMGIQAIHNTRADAAALGNRVGNIETARKNWRSRQFQAGRRVALYTGATVLGVAGAKAGYKAYKNWRNKAKEKTKFRDIEVYPEHGHAAVGVQPTNQPFYNEPNYRIREEFRERLINNILAAR